MYFNNQQSQQKETDGQSSHPECKLILLIISAFLCCSQLILTLITTQINDQKPFLITSLIITTAILIINYRILINGFKSLKTFFFTKSHMVKPDLFISLYSLLSYLYGVICLCLSTIYPVTTSLYFEAISTLLTLTTLNNYIQQKYNFTSDTGLNRFTTKISIIFNLTITAISVMTIVIWSITCKNFLLAFNFGTGILLLSYPCYLGLIFTLPVIKLNKISKTNGITILNQKTLEQLHKINLVIFDKTIITTKIKLTNIQPLQGNLTSKNLLQFYASIERHNNHPIAKAILEAYNNPSAYLEIDGFQQSSHQCIKASLGNRPIYIGNAKFIAPYLHQADRNKAQALEDKYQSEGKISLICATNDKLLGIIALTEVIPEEIIKGVQNLKKQGIRAVMLTEENLINNTKYTEIGVDKIITNVAPSEKIQYVEALKKAGYRILVIDSNNDSPAFQKADISVLYSNEKLTNADIIFTHNPFKSLILTTSINHKAKHNIKRGLFWSMIFSTLCLPITTGLLSFLIPFAYNSLIVSSTLLISSTIAIINALTLKI